MADGSGLSLQQRQGLGVALNEASWVDVSLLEAERRVALTFDVLTLCPDASEPEDRRRVVVLEEVGRVAVSLRNARWDDDAAPAVAMSPGDLAATVRSFVDDAIYGWEFIDRDRRHFDRWADRLSLDLRWTGGSDRHWLDLFQDEGARILDARIWFGSLQVLDTEERSIDLDAFIVGGTRWWKAMFAGDLGEAASHAIVPAAPDSRGP